MNNFYEKPSIEVLLMHPQDCVMETSMVGTEDYNQQDWTW